MYFQISQVLPRSEALADLTRLRWLIEHYYSYRDLLGVDLDAVFSDAAARVAGETDRTALSMAVMKILAHFGDGHTRLDNSQELLPGGFTPFDIEAHGEQFVAVREDGSNLLDEAYPYIRAIDGVEIDEWVRVVEPIVARGTVSAVRCGVAARLQIIQFARGELGRNPTPTLEIQLMTTAGKPGPRYELNVADRPSRGYVMPGFEQKILPCNIGYLRIASMESGNQFRDRLNECMEHVRETKGLIIDVRQNGGGSRDALLTLLPYLMSEEEEPRIVNVAAYRLHEGDVPDNSDGFLSNRYLFPASWNGWSRTERLAIERVAKDFRPDWTPPKGEFSDWHYMVISRDRYPPSFHYERPVVVLMDTGCFSATDIFLAGFKGLPRVTLMGMTSSGGSGRSIPYTLPNSGLSIRLSTMASFRADGTRYDGEGIKPDVEAQYTLSDLTGRTDTILERAVELIKETP